jgi:hypothetical protein
MLIRAHKKKNKEKKERKNKEKKYYQQVETFLREV